MQKQNVVGIYFRENRFLNGNDFLDSSNMKNISSSTLFSPSSSLLFMGTFRGEGSPAEAIGATFSAPVVSNIDASELLGGALDSPVLLLREPRRPLRRVPDLFITGFMLESNSASADSVPG